LVPVRLRAGMKLRMFVTSSALVAVAGLSGCGAGTTTTHNSSSALSSNSSATVARQAGREACEGLAPIDAARRFRSSARRAGVTKRFAALVSEPTPEVEASPGYPRLVASLYATTLPGRVRAAAAAGCAEELAASN
jgi:hypothetical protein